MEIEIRRVTSADLGLFEHVAEGVFDEPIRPDRLSAYLTEAGHHMVVALRDGEIVGQVAAVVHRHPDKLTELYVDEVAVTPALQRQGIARRMLDAIFAVGRSLGCEEAWIGTEFDNLPARALYENRGATAESFVMYVYRLQSEQKPLPESQ
jgi:aminoglycoside 6'-N-acetyltransferase I